LSQDGEAPRVEPTAEKLRIGYLWEVALKPWERHIYRQVTGSREFSPVVLCRKVAGDASDVPFPIISLKHEGKLPPWGEVKEYARQHILGTSSKVYNRRTGRLAEVARDEDLRLLHVFYGTMAISYLPALRHLRIPVTVSFHGQDVGLCTSRPELARELPALFDRADCIMVRSDQMGERLEAAGCPRSKLWINRAGVPLEQFPYVQRARERDEPVTFLQACRLVPKKGLEVTIRAFGLARRELPGARLWIAGDGDLRPALEELARELGLGDSVRFLGHLELPELVRTLHQAHVFVHPSVTSAMDDQEGIPNTVLEAMATGLAPISTAHAGIPEAVTDGTTGWLVERADPETVAHKMIHCALQPEECERMGAEARRHIEANLTLTERMRQLDEKYGQLIHATPHAGRR